MTLTDLCDICGALLIVGFGMTWATDNIIFSIIPLIPIVIGIGLSLSGREYPSKEE